MSWRETLQRTLRHPAWDRLIGLAFRDVARATEWISAGFILTFLASFGLVDGLTSRDSYRAFAWLPQTIWIIIFSGLLIAQVAAILIDPVRFALFRYDAMAGSLAFFITIAIGFWVGGVATTALGAYIVLSLAAFFALVYLLFEALRHG